MILIDIVRAGSSLRKLSAQDLSLKKAYSVYQLVQQMNKHLQYFDDNREKIAPLADIDAPELRELLLTEIEDTFNPIDINITENVELSVLDIMNLNGFINFIEPEEEDKEEK